MGLLYVQTWHRPCPLSSMLYGWKKSETLLKNVPRCTLCLDLCVDFWYPSQWQQFLCCRLIVITLWFFIFLCQFGPPCLLQIEIVSASPTVVSDVSNKYSIKIFWRRNRSLQVSFYRNTSKACLCKPSNRCCIGMVSCLQTVSES